MRDKYVPIATNKKFPEEVDQMVCTWCGVYAPFGVPLWHRDDCSPDGQVKLEHYEFNTKNFNLFSQFRSKRYRRGILQFRKTLYKTAQKTGLSVDEVYTIYMAGAHAMDARSFFKYFNTDPNFRRIVTNRTLYHYWEE